MAPRSWWKRWVRTSSKTIRGKSARRRPSCSLHVKLLEDRTVPTIVYSPHFGDETLLPTPNFYANPATYQPTYQTLTSPTVNIVFYGSALPNVSQLIQDAKSIVTSSSYFGGLTEFGGDGKAILGGIYVDSSFDDSKLKPSDSADVHQATDIAEIDKAIKAGAIADPPLFANELTAPIFVVVEDPKISNGSGGYNTFLNYTLPDSGGKQTVINFCAVKSPTRENFGRVFSHELVERMSNPTLDTNSVMIADPAGLPADVDGDDQVGDDEPDADRYLYRLGGSSGPFVQPYWLPASGTDTAFAPMVPIVPDGNKQVMTLIPSWSVDKKGSDVFNYSYDLVINGDQLAGRPNDNLTVDMTAAGTRVVFNNESFFFYAQSATGSYNNSITSITINLGSGTNTINLLDTNAKIKINGGGTDTVNIGNGGSVQGIQGSVNVANPPSYTTLNVDDSTDKSKLAVSISNGSITGLAPATITYAQSDLAALYVNVGTGRSAVNVLSTPQNPHGVTTTLTSYGPDTVVVGSAGRVQGIQGALIIKNPPNYDDLTIDDSADATGRTATIDTTVLADGAVYGRVVGLAPAAIEFRASDMNPPVQIQTGTGANTVNVQSTLDALSLVGHGPDTVNIGKNGSLQGIQQQVKIANPPNYSTVNIDDSADTTGHNVTMTSTSVTGLGPAPILYYSNAIRALNIHAGSGGSTFNVLSTPNHGAAGNTTTSLSSRGFDTVNVGNGSVQGVLGNLVLTNPPSFDAVTVDDSADATGRTIVLDTVTPAGDTVYGTIAGLAPGTIEYRAADTLSPVRIRAGAGNDTATINRTTQRDIVLDTGAGANKVTVLSTSANVTVNAQGAADQVNVGDAAHNLDAITSPVTVNGNGQTTLTVDDEANRNSQIQNTIFRTTSPTFTITGNSVGRHNVVTLSSSQGTSTTYYDANVAYSNVSGVTVQGGSSGNVFNVQASAVGTPVSIVAGAGNDTTNVGSAANVLDPIQGKITIDGQAGIDTLNVNDQGTTTSQDYAIYATSVHRLDVATFADNMAPVSYQRMSNVVINPGSDQSVDNGGRIRNITAVFGTAAGTNTTVNDSVGENAFAVDPYSSEPGTPPDNTGILGPVHFHSNNTLRFDYLNYNDSANSAPTTYTLTAGQIQENGFQPVTYDSNINTVDFAGSSQGGNHVNVLSAAPINTGIGAWASDIVTVGSAAPSLGGTLANLAQGGDLFIQTVVPNQSAAVILDDSGDAPSSKQVTFNNDAVGWGVSGLSPERIYLSLGTGSSVHLLGGSPPVGGNSYAIQSVPAGVSLTLDAGGGDDVIDVGSADNQLDSILGSVTINGQGGADMLNYNDQGHNSGGYFDYLLSDTSLSRVPVFFGASGSTTGDPVAQVTYADVATLNVRTSNAGTNWQNYVFIYGTAQGTTTNDFAGGGYNQFIVSGNNYNLDSIRGPLNILGTGSGYPNNNSVFIYDVFDHDGQTFLVTAGAGPQSGNVQRFDAATNQADMAPINYDGINSYAVLETANAYAPSGASDTVNLQSNAADLFTIIAAGAEDHVNVGSPNHDMSTIQGDVRIQGNTPTVLLDDSADTSSRSIDMAGDGAGVYRLTGLLPGSNVGLGRLWLELDAAAPVTLVTGAGDDTFHIHDFAAAPALAINGGGGVNTLDYSAFAGDVTVNLGLGQSTGLIGGVTDIRNVTGGIGNNLLVGDDLANVLIGGSGRNVLIGGGGPDQLFGGPGDNLLIAGVTGYDSDSTALQAILDEWTRTDVDFNTRISDLGAGVGPSNQTHLAGDTVSPDGAADMLTGGGQNWFILTLVEDAVNNQQSGDVLTYV